MSNDESNGSSDDLEILKLSQIPQPAVPSSSPDPVTQLGMDEEEVRGITNLILLAIGLVGILLLCVGIAIQFNLPADISGLRPIISIQGLILGMGIELAASALILYGVAKIPDEVPRLLRLMWVVFAFGLVLTTVPAFFNFGYAGDVLMSVGVEFFGAAIVFSLFENVTRTLNGKVRR